MAGLGEVTIRLTDDIAEALQKVGEELQTTKEACDEARIRQIVREELEAWLKDNASTLARVVAQEFAKDMQIGSRGPVYHRQSDGTYRASKE